MILKDFLATTKDKQVEYILSLETKKQRDDYLNNVKKKNKIVAMKIAGAIQSQSNIDSSIKTKIIDSKDIDSFSEETILLSKLKANPYQPRKIFDKAKIEVLADSIKEDGLLQNILVAKNNNEYIIIAGERRFRAFQLLEKEDKRFSKIPVKIIDNVKENDFKIKSVIENVTREDMNIVETANAYKNLKDLGMTLEDIKKSTGSSTSLTSRLLKITKLNSEVQNKIIELDIKSSNLIEQIARLDDKKIQIKLLIEIKNGLKISQLKSRVDKMMESTIDKQILNEKTTKSKLEDVNLIHKNISKQYKKLSPEGKIEADKLLKEIQSIQEKILILK
ncbi:MAG: ParB/RepB/Spo0J family partition protein [Campylobacterota bacterium]|nr:ParB/RepB/Spo0J family partition protein [Campylobacterota bacterium]